MKNVQDAIDRIVRSHYGGNWNDRRAAAWGKRLYDKPPVEPKHTSAFRNWLSTKMLSGR